MNDLLLHQLGKSLYTLECEGESLNDLLFPRQPGSGENAGRPPSRRGSTPPVNLAMLDLKVATENMLAFWAMQVPHDAGDVPASRSIVDGARWLQSHLGCIDDAPWGGLAAQEIIAQSQLVESVIDDSVEDDEPGLVKQGTCRVVASWARAAGVKVSKSTIHRWAMAGEIASNVGESGEVIVKLDDVLARSRVVEASRC